MTYHSLFQEDDDRSKLINSNNIQHPRSSSEQPKAALTKRVNWLHPLVHILPVIATASVIQLSLRGIYWDDDVNYATYWSTILQFPAKIHEILIVGSLSAMVLHIFRRMLLASDGVPMGLMLGAFQIGSAEYLFSKSYWKPVAHSFQRLQQKKIKTFLVALALGSSIIYSFLVGPASAAALLPNRGWWPMRNPFQHLPLKSYIRRKPTELYPKALTGQSSIHNSCLTTDYWNLLDCPAGGFNTLIDWAWTREQEGSWYNVTDSQHYNPTMLSSFSGQAQREIVTKLVTSEHSSTAAVMSATLHSTVLALTDAFWHYINSNTVGKINNVQQPKFGISEDQKVSIPLVQVQCQATSLGAALNSNDTLTFETGAMVYDLSKSEPNAYSGAIWNVPEKAWKFSRPQPWNTTNITWVNPSDVDGAQGEKLPSSLAVVVTVPAVWSNDGANGTTGFSQGSVVLPCVVDARWATTDVSFDIKEHTLKTSLTDWLDTANLTGGDLKGALSKWDISEPIAISPEWASLINDLPKLYYGEDGYGFMQVILGQFVGPLGTMYPDLLAFSPTSSSDEAWTTVYSNGIAIVLSTVITDWISRTALQDTNFTTIISSEENAHVDTIDLLAQKSTSGFTNVPVESFTGQTEIVYSVQRYGWGYGLNSKTIWFSIITLSIHTLLVLVYFLYTVFWIRTTGWTSSSWGTIGEILALAISSPPADEFSNSGAGIDRSGTWMTALRIREAGSDPHKLELVVGTRGGTVVPGDNKVKIDKVYS